MALTILITGCSNAYTDQTNIKNPYKINSITSNFTEGPHVFYKKGKVTVKNVHFSPLGGTLEEQSFDSKKTIDQLTCVVDDKHKTSFSFKLQNHNRINPTVYPQPEKLFAISDIEGNFEAFQKTLQGNGVINKDLNWSYGAGHLVLVGDFFDRGYNVTPVLWLIYKLEEEAQEAGGMVHFIIGNHEEMNMRGDVRYVKNKYIAAARIMNNSHSDLYSSETEIGRWLRTKNVIEKIGSTIFVHGGLSPQMAASRIRLESMNENARLYFGVDKWRIESRGGTAAAVFSKEGPMWYRGYFRENLDQVTVDHILNLYGAEHVVVGHTIVPSVSSLFHKKVIAIDVKHEIALSQKTPNSLFFKNGKIYASNVLGQNTPIENFMTEEVVLKGFEAVKSGNILGLQEFITPGKRVNKHFFGERITLLQKAIEYNQVGIVQLLIDNGADLNLLSENMTPLMHATKANNQAIVYLLIENGANINALNLQHKTPLFYCASNNNLEIAKVLVKSGVDIELKDRKGRTAEQYAIKNNNKQLAIFLNGCKSK